MRVSTKFEEVEFLMSSACIHEQNLGKILKYLHPNIVSNT